MKKKKKRKFNPQKFIKTWSIILVIVLVIVVFKNKKQDKQEEKQIQQTSSILSNTSSVLTVEIEEKPKIDSKTTDWNLVLVNKENPIPENYKCQLQTIEEGYQVDQRMVEPLNKMLEDARKQGLKPMICSAYRATTTQEALYHQKVQEHIKLGYSKEEAKEKASYWVTLPRTSEHEIGLAVDIIQKEHQKLDQTQEDTEVQKWLMEHCIEYGFVLRYPTYKHDITMINYEPWHYRYVGIENAKYMKENELCLEEYIEKIRIKF